MKKEPIKRYSLAFKQQVIREYEAGASVNSLRHKYAIGSTGTIKAWIKKYGRLGYRAEVVRIQSVGDHQEVQAMKARIQELEAALAQETVEKHMLNTTLEVASKALNIDLKKNFGKKSSCKQR